MPSYSVSEKPVIAFFPTNGAGMGHLTRCLAYARRISDKSHVYFFSQSIAVNIIEKMGFQTDYFISPQWSVNNTWNWNSELSVRFGLFLEHVRPDIVVFDGVWPYQGFLASCRAYRGKLKMVWSSRGLLKAGNQYKTSNSDHFDLIIRPCELGHSDFQVNIKKPEDPVLVPPVTLLRYDEILPRDAARKELGIGQDEKTVIFSLGAGNINSLDEIAERTIMLFQARNFNIFWARPPISIRDVEVPDYVKELHLYPLARYLRAFDIFVGAAGYNTCCEIAQTRIPSLIIPNLQSADNQEERGRALSRYAPAVVFQCESNQETDRAVEEVIALARSRKTFAKIPPLNGADLVSEKLLKLASK